MPRALSDTEKRTFIDLIRDRPFLWNKSNKDYSNKDLKARAYAEIGELFEPTISGDDAKTIYNALRSQLARECKKPPSGAEGGRGKPWPFLEALSFLKDSIKKRSTTGNLPPESSQGGTGSLAERDVDSSDEDGSPRSPHPYPASEPNISTGPSTSTEVNPTPPPSKKKRASKAKIQDSEDPIEKQILEQLEDTKQYNDEDHVYGLNVANRLKKLSQLRKVQAQAEIDKVLSTAQLEEIREQQLPPLPGYGQEQQTVGYPYPAQPGHQQYVGYSMQDKANPQENVLSVDGSNLQRL